MTYLIPDEAEAAQRFIKALSNVYRYILDNGKNVLVSLEQELEFLYSYHTVLHERFRQSFEMKIKIDPQHMQLHLPPLSLQMLVENAVKHNTVSRDYPLVVKIWSENKKMIYVHNKLRLKEVVLTDNTIGLTNINERYRLLSDEQISIEKSAGAFTVGLPLLVVQSEETIVHA